MSCLTMVHLETSVVTRRTQKILEASALEADSENCDGVGEIGCFRMEKIQSVSPEPEEN
jgi:hypothetical protein